MPNRYQLSLALALAAGLGLAGCTGGSTYGTGVGQEVQLLNDVTGLVALGGKKEETKIDYSPRPDLVRSPAGSELPPPVESAPSDAAGYFPTNPEERRAAALASAEQPDVRSGEFSGDGKVDALAETYVAPKRARPNLLKPHEDHYVHSDITQDKERRLAVLDARKQARGATGAGPRRWLTDPPTEYRTPAETAPVGDVGEREPRKRAKMDPSF